MGCANSKLDDSPAVALCRDRCAVLDEAIRQRYAFAEAHVAYLHSLKSVGLSLDRFFSQDLGGSATSPLSPVLNLPTQRKGDPRPPPQTSGSPAAKIEHHLDSSSDSGSHLHFHSDGSDDEDGSGTESLHLYHEVGSPIHHEPLTTPQLPYGTYFSGYENGDMNLTAAGGRFMNINYMKNQTTPSVIYTQRPMNLETMHIGESSAPSSSYYAYPNNQSSNPPYHVYNLNNNYGGYPNYPPYGAGDGFWGGSSSAPAPPYGGGFSSSSALASTSKAPPPPPAPMNPSAWDFFNPFESFDKFYPPYTSSRNSREVREEEGIPDLENGDDEVVKEIHGNQKFVDSGRSSHSKPDVSDKDAREVKKAELHHRAKPSVGNESEPPMEYEVHMVDKKVDAEKPKEQGNTSGFKRHGGFNGDSDVVRQIQVQFERASESGAELAKFLEAGKLPYKRKHGGRQVSSKILHLPLVSSQPSTSKSSDSANSDALDINQDLELRSKNLSSTLHKLYLWERKLHEEVKAEEKMRLLHERKSRKLKQLDEKGAEAHKVDATRALVKSLSTKIRIAIQVVDKISVKINTLRDEELWPQLNEFIQVLTRMWKSMLESHRIQRQAMAEAERLDAVALRRSHSSDAHVVATKQLEHELVNWTLRFSFWVGAQRGFVRALHTWLMKCLLYEPEETADGVAPFSPSRVGAPAIFVVCNQWWQSLERVSEEEVMGSMRAVALSVLEQWDRGKAEMRRRMAVDGGEEGRVKRLEKEDAVIQKGIQALERRMEVLLSSGEYGGGGQAVYQSETSRGGSLQARLQQLLEAMERFCASLVKVYDDLTQRVEEEDDGSKEKLS